MAESITEGTLKQWSKQIGDYVEQDEEIATIETDKIDVAVNAPEAGTIKEYLAKEEDTVTVGQDIVKLELGGPPQGGEKQQASQAPKGPASDSQPTSSDPAPLETQDQSKEDAPSSSPPSPQKSEKQPTLRESKANQPQTPSPKQGSQTTKPSNALKPESKSKESQIDAQSTPYSSRGERRASRNPLSKECFSSNCVCQVKMNRMRLRIAERLKQSQNTAASLTTFNEVDMSSIMQFRKLYKDDVLKKTGVKLGFMSAFSRACVLAMKEIPAVNASIEGPNGGDTIVYRDYVDISVAVATEKGLVTPVVRNAETMDLVGIEKAIADLGKKARS
ncbi:MAG: hypothetical protein Q9220_004506, partial [cf. Caloplaca sp. 1 TL-2023]